MLRDFAIRQFSTPKPSLGQPINNVTRNSAAPHVVVIAPVKGHDLAISGAAGFAVRADVIPAAGVSLEPELLHLRLVQVRRAFIVGSGPCRYRSTATFVPFTGPFSWMVLPFPCLLWNGLPILCFSTKRQRAFVRSECKRIRRQLR